MISMPPSSEWDVLWLRRLASLDVEQYRHYTDTFCQDVCMLQQQGSIGAPLERARAAGQLQSVSIYFTAHL